MNMTEVRAVLMLFSLAHDRQIPNGVEEIWAATLADMPFGLAKDAALELIKTSPFIPKVSELRDRARLIREERDRARKRQLQLEGRNVERPNDEDTGRRMVAHVLGRLADAGQNPAEGKFLGKERAGAIAEEAVREWLTRGRVGSAA